MTWDVYNMNICVQEKQNNQNKDVTIFGVNDLLRFSILNENSDSVENLFLTVMNISKWTPDSFNLSNILWLHCANLKTKKLLYWSTNILI